MHNYFPIWIIFTSAFTMKFKKIFKMLMSVSIVLQMAFKN